MTAQDELEGVPEPGQVILGKYRVDSVLGVGGMGAVVAATHLTLNQRAAIKFLLAAAAKNPKNIQRFMREAQAAARLQSEHVARVSDVGTIEDGTPYMVMEFLLGKDLCDAVYQDGPMAVDVAVRLLMQAMEAIAEAHKLGIVHRDLKPANLFLTQRPDGTPVVKVLDFGISKVTGPGGGYELTKTSAMMGSPMYMAPEQMKSAKSADSRADVWALGTILYELLGGRPPFVGETLPEVCSHVLTSEPPKLCELAPHVPTALELAIVRCLHKDPEQRYQNVAEFGDAIAPFGGDDALRSAATIRRVLGLPAVALQAQSVPQGPMATRTGGSPAVPAATGGYPSAPAPMTAPQGGVHGGVAPMTAPQGGVHGAGHAGVAPMTAPQGGAGAHMTPQGGAGAGQASQGHASHAAGHATAAPVAQTMPEAAAPRSGRTALIAVAALVLVAVAIGGVVVTSSGSGEPAAATTSAPDSADPAGTPTSDPTGTPTGEPVGTPTGDATAAASSPTATASASASSATATATPKKPIAGIKRPPRTVRPVAKPKPIATPKPAVKPKGRAADDLFNSRGD